MRYHYIPTEVSNTDKTKYWLGDRVGKVVEMQNSETTFEDSLTVSTKWCIILPYDPTVVFHGIYPKKLKMYIYT